MTYEEAIKTIETAKADVEWNYPMEYQIAFDIAIDCIKKQSPKKPVRKIFKERCFGNIQVLDACPTCGNVVEVDDNEGYGHECYPTCRCGQIIDWTGICDRGKWEDYEEVEKSE